MEQRLGCTRLLDTGYWVQSWVPGCGQGSRSIPGGMSCPLAGWGRCQGGFVPRVEELQAQDLSCQGGCGTAREAEPCAPHAAAGPAQEMQGKSWCGVHLLFLLFLLLQHWAQQDKPQPCQAEAKGTAQNKD